MDRLIDSAVFHVKPPEDSPESDLVLMERLLEIGKGISDIINGLADEKRFEDIDDRARAALTDAARNHYRLFVRAAIPGSFALPVEIRDTRETVENQDPLFEDYEINFKTVSRLVSLANTGNREQFYEEVKSPVVADRVLKGIQRIAPRDGECVFFTFGKDQEQSATVEQSAATNIIAWQSMLEGPFEKELVVTISSIDFDDNQLRVKMLGSGKKAKVALNDEISAISIGDVKNKKWKILCEVKYTPNGMIDSIDIINDIEELVLRDLVFDCFSIGDRTISFKEPLHAQEKLDDETQLFFVVDIPELCITVFSEYQEDMKQLVLDELANKWNWIVESEDSNLTQDAREVKRAFLSMVKGR